ncbi:MAG: hypothetical protein OEO19_20955 [Gammaproteobacteria bacterium]|nr:hypothetical protein [Gammaproteobacteria bacterium]MDH3450508.1 hypothetical protein [Gammaproteobacteria bacterium]
MIAALASNRFTLLALVLLAAGIVIYYQFSPPGRLWFIVFPSLLLMVNFLLAVATRGILRQNWPLMVFHFALMLLVMLAFLGQMSYFQGTLELAENEVFSGDPRQLDNVSRGPWHRYALGDASFSNLGFRINYHSGVKRDRTVNRIAFDSGDAGRRIVEIGDHVPLVVGHYRFYTSHNKGYAPVFEWRPSGSDTALTGSIHLPAYPINEYRQALEWRVPGSDHRLWTMLKIDENVLPEDRPFEFRVPRQHRIVVRIEDRRYEMNPGDRLSLAGGVLRYRELSTWMGYKIDYDWTRPWLLATAIIGLMALFVHYILKFSLPGSERLRGALVPRSGVRA